MEAEDADSNWSIHGLEFLFPYQTCYSLNILHTKYAHVCSIFLKLNVSKELHCWLVAPTKQEEASSERKKFKLNK